MSTSPLPPSASLELPSTRRLLQYTAAAIIGAACILVMVVLPAEYGIDPTGVGRVLGLTEMGEIKMRLASEAAADAAADAAKLDSAEKAAQAEAAAAPADSTPR